MGRRRRAGWVIGAVVVAVGLGSGDAWAHHDGLSAAPLDFYERMAWQADQSAKETARLLEQSVANERQWRAERARQGEMQGLRDAITQQGYTRTGRDQGRADAEALFAPSGKGGTGRR